MAIGIYASCESTENATTEAIETTEAASLKPAQAVEAVTEDAPATETTKWLLKMKVPNQPQPNKPWQNNFLQKQQIQKQSRRKVQ